MRLSFERLLGLGTLLGSLMGASACSSTGSPSAAPANGGSAGQLGSGASGAGQGASGSSGAGAAGAAANGAGTSGTAGTSGAGTSGAGTSSSAGTSGSAGAPSTGVVITPGDARVSFGGKVQFAATSSGAPGSSLVWSVEEGPSGGSVDANGLYTAPASSGTFHVKATSSSNASWTGTARVTVGAPAGTPPALKPGTWSDITPSEAGLKCCTGTGGNSFGASFIEVDPSDPRTLYVGFDQLGLWKSVDGGSTWKAPGKKEQLNAQGGNQTGYLDSPLRLRVDPGDSKHLYATQGVRGQTLGFWVSNDGGSTWKLPQGFADIAASKATRDVSMMAVDPTDFKHVILASHSPWPNRNNAGILESKDGGNTWVTHNPPSAWGVGTVGVSFLYDPKHGVGDAKTWLVGTDGAGFWRTSDAGESWTKVGSYSIPHGGHETFYAASGLLYAGATPYPVRSSDNGLTWQALDMGPAFSYYYSVAGDGKTLYTSPAYTGTNGGAPAPFYTSSESDGKSWSVMSGGQKFVDGPYMMRFDSANGIMYSASWGAGVLALKVAN